MTVREWAEYFADREFFPNPDQHVRLVLDSGVRVELKGTTVPMDGGDAVVELKASPVRKYRFSLKFEAVPVIEAHTPEEAKNEALAMMLNRVVRSVSDDLDDDSYEAREPRLLGEAEG